MLASFKAIFTTDPLSQVKFVHDYIQLVFQSSHISFYNPVTIHLPERPLLRNDIGFCDHLVALIEKRVIDVRSEPKKSLDLHFENRWIVSLSLQPEHYSGPEAYDARGADG